MIALQITDIKDFMNKLLCTETFDNFLLQEAVIQTGCTFNLDGRINEGFYSSEECESLGLTGLSCMPYGQVKSHCYSFIRGKHTPSFMKMVLLLSPANLERTLSRTKSSYTTSDITACFMNIRFQEGNLVLTTGISYKIFSVDKTFEHEWDGLIKRFLDNHGIGYEEM